MTEAADLKDFVAQRGQRDCLIAALASVIERTYEQVIDALKIPVDPTTTHPMIGNGVDPLDDLSPAGARLARYAFGGQGAPRNA